MEHSELIILQTRRKDVCYTFYITFSAFVRLCYGPNSSFLFMCVFCVLFGYMRIKFD